MQTLAAIFLLSLFLCLGDVESTGCTEEYDKKDPVHTRCLVDNPTAKKENLSEAEIQDIVDRHNEIRANVSDAANMLKMYWNETLAETAEKWAMQCQFGHDKNRKEPAFSEGVGQNMGSGWGSMSDYSFHDLIDTWAAERKVWIYGTWTTEAGHYIQEINSRSQYIGCGAAKCPVIKNKQQYEEKFLVCNYYPTTYADSPPFEKGKPCEKCEGYCKTDKDGKSICDCKNPMCRNGGTDPTTCKCKCHKFWAGDDCSEKFCPAIDQFYPWCKTLDTTHCSNPVYVNACPRRCDHPICKPAA